MLERKGSAKNTAPRLAARDGRKYRGQLLLIGASPVTYGYANYLLNTRFSLIAIPLICVKILPSELLAKVLTVFPEGY